MAEDIDGIAAINDRLDALEATGGGEYQDIEVPGIVGGYDYLTADQRASVARESQRRYDYDKGIRKPALDAAQVGRQSLVDLLNDPSSIVQTPYYKFIMKQGIRSVQQTAAAKRGLFSGATMDAVRDRGAAITANEIDRYANLGYRLASVPIPSWSPQSVAASPDMPTGTQWMKDNPIPDPISDTTTTTTTATTDDDEDDEETVDPYANLQYSPDGVFVWDPNAGDGGKTFAAGGGSSGGATYNPNSAQNSPSWWLKDGVKPSWAK